MNEPISQATKAKQLHALHYANKTLILPNIWDVLGAKLLQDLGYEAIATASAAVAYANGYNDGENIPFADVLKNLTNIAHSVNVPVTADIESGYANDDNTFENNIRAIIETGIVGINIEDTNKQSGGLFSIEEQHKRIELIKKVSAEMQIDLFINARTDTFVHQKKFNSENELLKETTERGNAYKDAGANCFYPILMHQQNHIEEIVEQLKMPVNILMMPRISDLKTLEQLGIARVSLGPGFLKYAIKAMKELATKLKDYGGLDEVIRNDVTSDYLKHLVTS